MIGNRTAWWGLAALLGIAVTATLAWTASQIAGQRIGLSSEPLSVSSGLAPAAPAGAWHGTRVRHGDRQQPTQTVRTVTATSTAAIAPSPSSGPSAGPSTSPPPSAAPISLPTTSPASASATHAQQSQSASGHEDNGGGSSSSGGSGASSSSGSGASSSSGGGHRDD